MWDERRARKGAQPGGVKSAVALMTFADRIRESHSSKKGMTMGVFNNESDKKAGLDPLIVTPQSSPAQAAQVSQPAGRDAASTASL